VVRVGLIFDLWANDELEVPAEHHEFGNGEDVVLVQDPVEGGVLAGCVRLFAVVLEDYLQAVF
jgi:hypothetical protein